jgi:cytochrome c oxidase cbb3-type subunit I/II
MNDSAKTTITYNDAVVRAFLIITVVWGLVGMTAGVLIALQLSFHFLNFDTSFLTFGRLRPLHTNAAIFAFVGNMMFAGIYHSTQRLVKARLASNFLSWLHFWGWQAVIVAAAITLPLGLSRGKEYAELIWPINIAVVVLWVVFAINFFWTLARRNEPTLYVAIWFYIATIVTVAMLYIVNHLQIPTGWLHAYPIFGGVQDALVQWWYGHNAVAFFLTTPILGIMYYYVPKAAGRPVYSYRLSVVHFWSLVFIYIWAGPHHLLNTSLPEWLQSLGMLFSLMLWAPSWGGMLNGLLTLRGAWDKVRTDPVLKFLAAGVTFYGMSTFEGPLLAIKSINALSHYTDWTIGHVHSGTLGWNGFMAAGMFYWMAPRLWNTRLHSVPLANLHFWLGMVGILLYIASMWVSGITQGLMLNQVNADGTLTNPVFLDALLSARTMMYARAFGGFLYLTGFFLLAYNLWKTIRSGTAVDGTVEIVKEHSDHDLDLALVRTLWNAPTLYSIAVIAFTCLWTFGNRIIGFFALAALILVTIGFFYDLKRFRRQWGDWYDRLLANPMPFTILTLLAVLTGGLIQIVPLAIHDHPSRLEGAKQPVYTPLELAGRDIYVSEGCYNCHSQMVRPFVSEVLRYGDYSKLAESIYDHPFQWGSKRTGPDLHRVGGKYPHLWHWQHMQNPRSTSPGSNMPNYPWLYTSKTDTASLPAKIKVQQQLGVPFPDWSEADIRALTAQQADAIVAELKKSEINPDPNMQIVALIAYLQKLGRPEAAPAPAGPPTAGVSSPSQP